MKAIASPSLFIIIDFLTYLCYPTINSSWAGNISYISLALSRLPGILQANSKEREKEIIRNKGES